MMPLWDYSTKVYAIPEVQERLLALQDRFHIDVNAVLWCLWCGRYGFGVGEDEVRDIIAATSDMARHTTRPLRTVRLYLSSPKVGFDPSQVKELRDKVLNLEIMSEEMVLRRLETVTRETEEPDEALDDMAVRSETLFTTLRRIMDMPTMIADEDSVESPIGLFRELRDRAQDEGP